MKKSNNLTNNAADSETIYSASSIVDAPIDGNDEVGTIETSKNDDALNIFLSVFADFREYKKGDFIHDETEILKILGSHEKNMVNRVLKNVKN